MNYVRGNRFALLMVVAAACLLVSSCSSDSAEPQSAASPDPTFDVSGREVAQWKLAPGELTPSDQEVDVLISWVTCTSAAKPRDPQAVLQYGEQDVTLTVWAVPPEGNAFECPANPWVPVTVQLDQPLGDRAIVPGPEKPY